MCWIAGVITTLPKERSSLEDACHLIDHRGPDAKSYWTSEDQKIHFWHVRLSIVDLDPRSTQPFEIDGGEYVIVFNGEIYNYKKLRQELEARGDVEFRTTSDTEVLIRLYKLFGKKCLEQIEGMFAFAIYDKKNNEIFFARDFAGQKPLVYSETPEGVFFASEIPALFALSESISREVDKEVLKVYLLNNFSHIPPPLSFYTSVKKLPNAHYMIVRNGQVIEVKPYTHLEKKQIDTSQEEIPFLDTILDEMRPSDVWYASFLSGGIDSSYICSVLKAHETTPTEAYTLKIPGNDEDYNRAKYVAEKLWLIHHTIELRWQDLLASVEETVKNMGEPYFHITSVYADLILREAKKWHRVFFTWSWGDECYYGYDNIQFLLLEWYFSLQTYIPIRLKKWIDMLTCYKFSAILFSTRENFKEHLYRKNFSRIAWLFQEPSIPEKPLSQIHEALRHFVKTDNYIDTSYMYGLFVENLHSLTLQWDAIGMKNSLEIRSLFLEKRVIERAYSIPLWKKISIIRLREGKEILRRWLAKILGKYFVYAKKIWFGVHFNFRKYFWDMYRERIQETLKHLDKRNIFVPWFYETLLADFEKHFLLIMKLYALEKCLEMSQKEI